VEYEITISQDDTGRYFVILFRETVGSFNHDRSEREQLGQLISIESPLFWQIENLVHEHIGSDETTYKNVLKQVRAMLWANQFDDKDENVLCVGRGPYRISVTKQSKNVREYEFLLFKRVGPVVQQIAGPLVMTTPTRSVFARVIASRWTSIDSETLHELTDALEAAGCFGHCEYSTNS